MWRGRLAGPSKFSTCIYLYLLLEWLLVRYSLQHLLPSIFFALFSDWLPLNHLKTVRKKCWVAMLGTVYKWWVMNHTHQAYAALVFSSPMQSPGTSIMRTGAQGVVGFCSAKGSEANGHMQHRKNKIFERFRTFSKFSPICLFLFIHVGIYLQIASAS